jgi:GTP-binding protein Era
MTGEPAQPKCGFVALVGIPNAGKSTLLNALVGAKVSIVSPKVQTTRTRVLGLTIEGDAQLIFVDTPGIFSTPKRRLERAMVAAAWSGAADADVVVVLIDAQRGFDPESQALVAALKETGRTLILALNKIDLVRRDKLLALTTEVNDAAYFTATFMVSAETGSGVGDLRADLARRMPAGHWAYPEDQLADMPVRLLAAEFTREQLFLQLFDELPYSLMVETEKWEEFKNGSVKIDQIITIQRESQRAIVLGKGGAKIRKIGEAARGQIAAFLERPVHLFLHVKVREDWIEDPARYKDIGLEYDS